MKKVLMVLIFVFLVSCADLGLGTYDVKYKVYGTSGVANITLTLPTGELSQGTSASIPWSFTCEGKVGSYVSLTAQNKSTSGTITVEIHRDGKIFKSITSYGGYAIASVSGTL